jgi:hypothetical protein
MSDPNTYTPDWRVDVEPEQADDYDSTNDDTDDSDSDDSESSDDEGDSESE